MRCTPKRYKTSRERRQDRNFNRWDREVLPRVIKAAGTDEVSYGSKCGSTTVHWYCEDLTQPDETRDGFYEANRPCPEHRLHVLRELKRLSRYVRRRSLTDKATAF